MADPPRYPDTGDEPDRGSTTGTPRWVKVFGIIVLVLVLGFVILKFGGGGLPGDHGPGRHAPSGGGGDTLPSSVIEDYTPPGGDGGGHTPPEGGHG